MTDTPFLTNLQVSPLQRFGVDRKPIPSIEPSGALFKTDKAALTVEQQIASYEKMFLDIMSDKGQFYGKMTQLGMRPTYNSQINGLMRGLTFSESKGVVGVKTNAGAEWQAKDKSAEDRLAIISAKLTQVRDLVELSKETKEARANSPLHARVVAPHARTSQTDSPAKASNTDAKLSTGKVVIDPIIGQPSGLKTNTTGAVASVTSDPITVVVEPKLPQPLVDPKVTANANIEGGVISTPPGSDTLPKTADVQPHVDSVGPAADMHIDFESITSTLDLYGMRGERLRRNEQQLRDLDQALYFTPAGMLVRSSLFDSYNAWLDNLEKSKNLKGDDQKVAREKATDEFTKNVDNILNGSDGLIAEARKYGLIGTTQRTMETYAKSSHDPHLTSAEIREVAEKYGIELGEDDFLLRNEDGFKILQMTLEGDTRGKANQQRLALYNHFSAEKESTAKTNDGRAKDRSLGWKDRIEALAAWKSEESTKIGDNEAAKARLETEYQKRAKSITDEFRSEVVAVIRDVAGLPKQRHGFEKFAHDLGELGKKAFGVAGMFLRL